MHARYELASFSYEALTLRLAHPIVNTPAQMLVPVENPPAIIPASEQGKKKKKTTHIGLILSIGIPLAIAAALHIRSMWKKRRRRSATRQPVLGLISLSELDNKGYKFTGQVGVIKVSKGALVVMKGIRVGNLYKLLGSTMTDETYAATENDDLPLRLWHRRFCHMSEKGMKVLVEKKLIPDITFSDSEFCEHCVYGKHHKRSFKAGSHTSKGILDYIHTDVWSSPTTSYGGANYYISFINDFSRKVWVKFLKSKGDIDEKLDFGLDERTI
uniref:GAG-pre-integrase domain-containing protein n=1 Tax=Ananas comosus var. bracteatus TaxID=296719 RepID=A0A6V7PER4_ANACO|nr:unnamed protein product [Ananas comosus var. bracteatus]